MGIRLELLATGLLASSALATGCSNSGDDPGRSDAGADYSVLGALGELPASVGGDVPLILTGDLTRASEVAGLDRPSDADDEEVTEWVADISGASGPGEPARVYVPLPDALFPFEASPADMHAQVGWSVVDVDTFVALDQPPERFLVVTGDFDEDTLDEDLFEVEDGIVTDVVADDHEQSIGEPTAFSLIGAPTRLAEDDARIAASSTTAAVRDWLDGERSLADDSGYADVAKAFDERDVYTAVIAVATAGVEAARLVLEGQVTVEELEAYVVQLEEQLPEASYDTVGVGWSADDGGPLVAAAYHFDSEDAAEDSVDRLRELYSSGTSLESQRPFSDYLEIEDVGAEGSVVVVTSRPAGDGAIGFLHQALVSRDLLFVSR